MRVGPLSVLIIWGVLASVGSIGVSAANTGIVASQIFAALILDILGASGQKLAFCWEKAVGAALFARGVYLLVKQPGQPT